MNINRSIKDLLEDYLYRSDDGEVVTVFRGEYGQMPDNGGLQSKLPSITFSTEGVAEIYANQPNDNKGVVIDPRVLSGTLLISNPFVNDSQDCFLDLSKFTDAFGIDVACQLAIKFEDSIRQTNNWEEIEEEFNVSSVGEFLDLDKNNVNQLYCDAYYFFDDKDVVAMLKEAGFDGAIHQGNGESAVTPEYKIFSEYQFIKDSDLDNFLVPEKIYQMKVDLIKRKIVTGMRSGGIHPEIRFLSGANVHFFGDSLMRLIDEGDPVIASMGENLNWAKLDYVKFSAKIVKEIDAWLQSGCNKNNPYIVCNRPVMGEQSYDQTKEIELSEFSM